MLVTSYSVNRWGNAGNWRWATVLLPFSLVYAAKVTTFIHTFTGRGLCQLQKSTKTFSFFHFFKKIRKMTISLSWSSKCIDSFHLRGKGNQIHWWDWTYQDLYTESNILTWLEQATEKQLKPRKGWLEKCQLMNQMCDYSNIKDLLFIRAKLKQQHL